MTNITLNWSRKNRDERLRYAARVANALRNNPHFSEGNHMASRLDTAVGLVVVNNDTMANLERQLKTLRMENAALMQELEQTFTNTASWVGKESGGDAKIILSAGLSVRKTPQRVGAMPKVSMLEITYPTMGQLLLNWTYVDGAVSYELQAKVLDGRQQRFQQIKLLTRSSLVLPVADEVDLEGGMAHPEEGVILKRGVRYAFRVAAVGAEGRGFWSDPVERIAV